MPLTETDALTAYREERADIVLLDINLPGISGTEAMKIIRQDGKTAHIPIVALSANAIPRDIEKGLEAGFFRYLTKPIKVNEFMETLNVALEFAESGAATLPSYPYKGPGTSPES